MKGRLGRDVDVPREGDDDAVVGQEIVQGAD